MNLGLSIERSTNGIDWVVLVLLHLIPRSYTNTGLSASTLYDYQVKAFNATGDSGYTNTASASTDVAAAISLTATGFKVKGKHNADLS